ncbi:SagB family peptide dehydrogenase [Rugosimonospora africana]|uniref:Nitroreductase domain-containing protein n=1 Tax=Rugosimonospora africana TaxID=556532 RepID=A0A8J3VVT9_9ACTN|nr:SagB family peptide dehydrogenase [Rugosimonospora africana]GIH21027.1 hypothetical protein Raf01_91990 [Rugosimonospora africana]
MDARADAVIRPRLRRDAVLHPTTDGAVLQANGETMWLAGANAYRLLSRLVPRLTGERTVREICAGLPAAKRETVSALIRGLLDRGAVIDIGQENGSAPSDPRFRAQYEYLAHAGDAPAEGFRRWRTARILLTGNGISLQAAVLGLLRNGAGPVFLAAPPGWPLHSAVAAEAARLGTPEPVPGQWPPPPGGDGYDIVLYSADRAEPDLILDMIGRARNGGAPVLAAAALDGRVVIGPTTTPGSASCWWCAAAQLGLDPARPVDPTGALTPLVARMIGGALAFAAFGELTGVSPSQHAVVQQLRTLETSRPVVDGGCPVCHDHASDHAGTPPAREAPATPGFVVRTVRDMPAASVREYSAVVHRLVRSRPAPADFQPDWNDQPAAQNSYPRAALIALPEDAPATLRPFAAELAAGPARSRFSLPTLAWLLRMSYGRLSRRLRVDSGQPRRAGDYAAADWRRGAVSGGGLYPLEIYWVAGNGGPLPAGIYHYAPGHHALERLALGNHTGRVRQVVPHPQAQAASQFLLITLSFWRNAFKYANLAYHIGTIDLGALLGALGHLGAAIDLPVWRLLWFDDQALNELLGLDTAVESVLAVVPMPWQDGQDRQDGQNPPACAGPADRPAAFERSRTLLRFACTARVHGQTMWSGQQLPDADDARRAAVDPAPAGPHRPGDAYPLPEPAQPPPTDPVSDLLPRRRSSSGAMVATPPLELPRLASVLRLATRTSGYRSDTTPDGGPTGWTRLSVLANHIAGLPAGGYLYDPGTQVLHRSATAPTDRWLDVLAGIGVSLMNYDLNQAAAVLVVSGRSDAMIDHCGPRGYRLLNAEVGTVAQSVYLTATAVGLGCGAVLNLDHVAVDQVLGFDGTDERTLLCLLIGGERDGSAEFDHRLY